MSDVVGADWRESLEQGRFEESLRLYLLADEPSREVKQALMALTDIVESVRSKSWTRVERRLDRLEEKPPVVDWPELQEELELLERSSRQLDDGHFEEALEVLELRRFHWFAAEAANQRGTAHIRLGQLTAARLHFEEATELDPRHYRALTNLGNARLEEGDVDAAIECYEQALKVNDEFANAYHNLGVAYRRKGQVGRSVRQLRRAQRVQGRSEREQAREKLGQGSDQPGLKLLRWSLYGLVALALYMVLRSQGFF